MTFRQRYLEAQNELEIISPSSGESLYIWQIILESEGQAEVKFSYSGALPIAKMQNGSMGIMNPNMTNSEYSSLLLTCSENTTVTILYDEIQNN